MEPPASPPVAPPRLPTDKPAPAVAPDGDLRAPRRRPRRPLAVFSELERRVLRLESEGRSVAQIAAALGVNERSVRDARQRAHARLGGQSLAGLAELIAD